MKILFRWHVLLIISAVLLLSGICLSAVGLYLGDFVLGYAGLLSVTVICGSWWVWVMSLIHKVLLVSQRTIERANELKDDIREFRILLKNTNSLFEDK